MAVYKVDFENLRLPSRYNRHWDGTILIKSAPSVVVKYGARNYDFTSYNDDSGRLSEVLFWLAHALAQWAVGKQSSTIHERFHALKHFLSYLSIYQKGVRRLIHITPTMLDQYCLWIRTQNRWHLTLRRRAWTVLNQSLVLILHCRPVLLRKDLPSYRFSSPGNSGSAAFRTTKDSLSRQEMGAILSHCRRDIVAGRKKRILGKELKSAALSKGYEVTRKPSYDSIGEILAWIEDAYFRRKVKNVQAALRYFMASRSHAPESIDELYSHFLFGFREAAPYLILIAAYTGANTTSLLSINLNCLEPVGESAESTAAKELVETLAGPRDIVLWDKKRSGYEQVRSFPSEADFLPPVLIRELIALTAPLRPLAESAAQKKLFIADSNRRGPFWIRQCAVTEILGKYRRKHKLPYFTLGSLRAALTNFGFLATNGDILATKKLTNHRSADTTQNIYLRTVARRKNDETLGILYVRLIKWLAKPSGKQQSNQRPPEQRYEAMPVIDVWLELFSTPTAVIMGTSERIAHLVQLREHLLASRQTMHPVRWTNRCAGLFEILTTQVLPRFSSSKIASATELAKKLPPLPPLE